MPKPRRVDISFLPPVEAGDQDGMDDLRATLEDLIDRRVGPPVQLKYGRLPGRSRSASPRWGWAGSSLVVGSRELGAEWAGASDDPPPVQFDAAIVFAPVGALVPAALRVVARGGTVGCAGIHMSDIPSFPYAYLWSERSVRSVANLTRRDGEEFLALAPARARADDRHVVPARSGRRGARGPPRRPRARRRRRQPVTGAPRG